MTSAVALKHTAPWRERFDAVEGLLPGAGSPGMRELRRAAAERFFELGFPTTKWESWRYFEEVRKVASTSYRSAAGGRLAREAEKSVLDYLVFGKSLRRAVFVNGAFAPAVSNLGQKVDAMQLRPLSAALAAVPEMVEPHLGTIATMTDQPFVALNTAFSADGLFIQFGDGMELDRPLHLIFLSEPAATPSMTHPRVIIVAGKKSRATIIETWLGAAGGMFLNNAVTEIHVGEDAEIAHYKVQEEGPETTHVAMLAARVLARGRLHTHAVMLGGAAARHDVQITLAGEGARCQLDGLSIGQGEQTHDLLTTVDHALPHCQSAQTYKAVLDDRSKSSFTGRVIVRPGAQKSDAEQSNRNLLLSDDATVNTRPQLEIYADDVKCSHGATSGQLDREALFYLRTRGIRGDDARLLLMRAFVDEIIDRSAIEELREHLHSRIDGKVARDRKKKEMS